MTESSPSKMPDGLRPLGKACQAMNFQRIHDKPPVIVTMDHRAVLVIAWAAMREGVFGKNEKDRPDTAPLLLRWDAHPDVGERPRPWAFEKARMTDLDSVTAIANAQRHDDGGWVVSAMQFGLAGDVLSGGIHEYHRIEGDNSVYEDHRNLHHRMKIFCGFSDLLSAYEKYADFHGEQSIKNNGPGLWFDIDLDFATNRSADDSISLWTEEDWQKHFPDAERERWAKIMESADLVTLSLEPWFCGSVSDCGKIAAMLSAFFRPHTDVLNGL